jgi:hypothetical protein
MQRTIKLRRGSSVSWLSKNPILEAGELGIEIDTNRFKIGDGSRHWTSLVYFADEDTLSDFIVLKISELSVGITGLTVEDLNNHISSETPHPVYDDGPSLELLYENAKV